MLDSMSLHRRVFVLLLGAFLALGMNLSVVQAASMPVKMAMTSGMGSAGHCKDCSGNGGIAKEMGNCSLSCATPILAAIPQTAPTKVVLIPAAVPQQGSLLLGRAFSPDPGPPRSHDIG